MQSLTSKPKLQPFARNRFLRDASWQAVYDCMKADAAVHVFGEGAHIKAHYDAPKMLADFPDRIHTMPICEDASVNFGVGTSLLGVTPIVDVISADFLYRAMDSICNTAAKLALVRSEPSTIVIRAEFLLGGPTTGQRPEALFAHVPGLRVVIPSTPRDAYGLMRTALETPGVTLYFEDREIKDDESWDAEDLRMGEVVPFGVPMYRTLKYAPWDRGRKVPRATVLTYGVMRQRVEMLVQDWLSTWDGDEYEDPNYEIDLIDLRTIYPVDFEYLQYARYGVKRTKRLLFIEPDVAYGGVGAEILAHLAETMPFLKVARLGARRSTAPAAPSLHGYMLPTDKEILDAITSLSERR